MAGKVFLVDRWAGRLSVVMLCGVSGVGMGKGKMRSARAAT